MPRPQFENQTLISAVTNKSIAYYEYDSIESLPPNVYDRVTILSPKNTVSRLFNVMMSWEKDTLATSGTKFQYIDVQVDDTKGIGILRFEGAHNVMQIYDKGDFSGITAKNPNDLGAVSNQINNVVFDDKRGMQLVYRHSMDVDTTAHRVAKLFFEREVVAR